MELKDRFIQDISGLFSQLRHLLDHQQFGSVDTVLLQQSHALKSLALQVGEPGLAKHIHTLEGLLQRIMKGTESPSSQEVDLINRLERQFHIAADQVDQLRNDPSMGSGNESLPGAISSPGGAGIPGGDYQGCTLNDPILRTLVSRLDTNLEGIFRLISRGYTCYTALYYLSAGSSSPRFQQLKITLEQQYPVAHTSFLAQERFAGVVFSSPVDPTEDLGEIVVPGIFLVEIRAMSYQDLLRHRLGIALDLPLNTEREDPGALVKRLYSLIQNQSRSLGKTVQPRIVGELNLETHIADTVEAILGQLVSNALEHGIESLETRLARGKDPEGQLTVIFQRFIQENVIILEDDGGGDSTGDSPKNLLQDSDGAPDKPVGGDGENTASSSTAIGDPPKTSAGRATISQEPLSGHSLGKGTVQWQVQTLLQGSYSYTSEPRRGTRIRIGIPRALGSLHVFLIRVKDQALALPMARVLEPLHRLGLARPRRISAQWFGLWEHRLFQILECEKILGDSIATGQSQLPAIPGAAGQPRDPDLAESPRSPQSTGQTSKGYHPDSAGCQLMVRPVPELQEGSMGQPSLLLTWGAESARILLIDEFLGLEVLAAGPRYHQTGSVYSQHTRSWIPVIAGFLNS